MMQEAMDQPPFLPLTSREALDLGIDQLDIILVSGDAYVDHPSFGAALIGRVLWDAGYTVGIIDQPDWRSSRDLKRLGTPRLFFGITSGNVDSMVNHYTANLKRRRKDVYSPAGALRRPDRAAIVYADRVHALFPGVPVILGGIEASLRRFAHYDYWSDSVRQSILADAPADMIVFGMGEVALLKVAERLHKEETIGDVGDVPGTAVKMEVRRWREVEGYRDDWLKIPGYAEVARDKRSYASAFRLHYQEQEPFRGRVVVQPHPKTVIIQNPPARPLQTEELDRIYELPYAREAHPSYRDAVPALEPVRFSITSHRGCFGSCHFCALTHHQGRIIQSRSQESVVREVEKLTTMPNFRGVIQDVGGPTANMYGTACCLWSEGGCGKLCTPECQSLDLSHRRYLQLLRRLREVPGVRHVFIGSGIRHDLVLADSPEILKDICHHHVSGHLKIAPEHVSDPVTRCMNKPPVEALEAFQERFDLVSRELGKEQYLLPYFMSGHPGCTIQDMVRLAEYIRDHRLYTEQVQDFTPTPMTVSTAMYHTGLDPFTMEAVHIPRGREKRIQRALMHYRDPQNYWLVRKGLKMAGREDLIGGEPRCLIPQRPTGEKKRMYNRPERK